MFGAFGAALSCGDFCNVVRASVSCVDVAGVVDCY